jgi:hypothetical protein
LGLGTWCAGHHPQNALALMSAAAKAANRSAPAFAVVDPAGLTAADRHRGAGAVEGCGRVRAAQRGVVRWRRGVADAALSECRTEAGHRPRRVPVLLPVPISVDGRWQTPTPSLFSRPCWAPGWPTFALKYQLPSFAMLPTYARSEGLMAYGANAPHNGGRACCMSTRC